MKKFFQGLKEEMAREEVGDMFSAADDGHDDVDQPIPASVSVVSFAHMQPFSYFDGILATIAPGHGMFKMKERTNVAPSGLDRDVSCEVDNSVTAPVAPVKLSHRARSSLRSTSPTNSIEHRLRLGP